MPEFTTVSVQEAQLRTIAGRQGSIMNEYVDYIQQLPTGQAGKLHVLEQENPLTIRRRLVTAAKALDIKLIIKRSGTDLYFWREDGAEEQPRPRRGRRARRQEEETGAPKQPMIEPEFPASDNSDELVPRIEPDLPSSTL
jgi:hypothetical protein